MRIPISTKLVLLTVLVLLVATIPIALRTSQIFAKSSMQREEYSNQAFAASRAVEVENILSSLIDKSKTTASLLYKSTTNSSVLSSDDFEMNFIKDKRFISMEILKLQGTTVELLTRRTKDEFSNQISSIRDQQKFPVRSVAQGAVEIRNGSFAKGPAMFTIGLPLVKDPQGRITHVALVDIALSVLQKPFAEKSERTLYLIDRNGELITHQDEQKALARLSMAQSPLVKKSMSEQTPRRQMRFQDPDSGAYLIGAYNKTSFGVTVVSQIPEELVLEPAQEAKRQA
ncbi:MAG: cache domain-containing protein, partial [Pseudobdellovibrionaceae bacterium]